MAEEKEKPVAEQKMGFALEVSTTPEGLAQSLCLLRYPALVETIKALDQYVGDWDFTLELAAYFAEQMKAYAKDCVEDSDTANRIIDQAYRLLTSIEQERK